MTASDGAPEVDRQPTPLGGSGLPPMPPEWVPLVDLLNWIKQVYGVYNERVRADIRDAVHGRSVLPHRISGIKPDYGAPVRRRLPPGMGSVNPYFNSERIAGEIFVNDWDAVEVDWHAGTVGGWGMTGERKRLPIEIWWRDVAKFADPLMVGAWKQAGIPIVEPLSTTRKLSVHAIKALPRSLGGRPALYDWDSFVREVVRIADHPDGLPSRTQLAKDMATWCLATWGREPAESLIRDKIAKIYPT